MKSRWQRSWRATRPSPCFWHRSRRAFGSSSGEEDNGGRRWRWTQSVQRSPDPRLQQIEIQVAGPAGDTAASLSLVRSAK